MNEQKIMSILLEPKVTEKSSMIGELNNQYVFKVSKSATKPEIKKAIDNDQLCLIGIAGDCDGDVVLFDRKNKKLVDTYLISSFKLDLLFCEVTNRTINKFYNESKYQNELKLFRYYADKMIENGIFNNKWQNRTTWKMDYYAEFLEKYVSK